MGLAPAIVQDAVTGEVLMLGFMNRAAYDKTLATGYVTFYSRTRNELWTKGDTSGNRLRVISAAGRLRLRHYPLPGRGRGQGRGLSHWHAHLLQHRACQSREVRDEAAARHSQGQPAGRDAGAAGPRGIAGICQSAIVFCRHQRSRDRVHAHSRAGDGALRRARRARCRA